MCVCAFKPWEKNHHACVLASIPFKYLPPPDIPPLFPESVESNLTIPKVRIRPGKKVSQQPSFPFPKPPTLLQGDLLHPQPTKNLIPTPIAIHDIALQIRDASITRERYSIVVLIASFKLIFVAS